jgi:nitric oxide reductase subunit B
MSTIPLVTQRNRSTGYSSDRAAKNFLILALAYLVLGMLFGTIGSFQYLLPEFLQKQLSFQKSRPLHVYLAIGWIFTAAQGLLYYYMPRAARRKLVWEKGPRIHFAMQLIISTWIIGGFIAGKFGGREYLEFPPYMALLIAASWVPFAYNFFATIRPNFLTAPVYIWSWSAGIVFFFITLGESYLWTFNSVMLNPVRDITIQWKALGSMVGSWNMLIYGSSIFLMYRLSGNKDLIYSKQSFFFFFVGLTNLMFNWGHHTYVVPAAPWIATTSYVISMTELVIFGNIIWKFRKTVSEGIKNREHLTHKLLFLADLWIFANLGLAIAISIPSINAYTHGTHITVAHAMGATIGINSMLLLASIVYIGKTQAPDRFRNWKAPLQFGVSLSNASLFIFWLTLVGSGLIRIQAKLDGRSFQSMMEESRGLFKWFAGSGTLLAIGFLFTIIPLIKILSARHRRKHGSISVVKMEERSKPVQVAE